MVFVGALLAAPARLNEPRLPQCLTAVVILSAAKYLAVAFAFAVSGAPILRALCEGWECVER